MELHEKRFARFVLGIALTGASLLVSSAAAAQSQPKESYGWQILVVDLVADAALATGAVALGNPSDATSSWAGPLEVTAAVAYVAGGPAVHLAHQRAGRAAISFGLRVGPPLVLGLAGWAIAWALYHPVECNPSPSPPYQPPCDTSGNMRPISVSTLGIGVGAGVGVLSASAIDIAVLAREPASSEPAKPSGHSAQLLPSLVVLPRATTVRDAGHRLVPVFGIAGTF